MRKTRAEFERMTSDQLLKAMNAVSSLITYPYHIFIVLIISQSWEEPQPSMTLILVYLQFVKFHFAFFDTFLRLAMSLDENIYHEMVRLRYNKSDDEEEDEVENERPVMIDSGTQTCSEEKPAIKDSATQTSYFESEKDQSLEEGATTPKSSPVESSSGSTIKKLASPISPSTKAETEIQKEQTRSSSPVNTASQKSVHGTEVDLATNTTRITTADSPEPIQASPKSPILQNDTKSTAKKALGEYSASLRRRYLPNPAPIPKPPTNDKKLPPLPFTIESLQLREIKRNVEYNNVGNYYTERYGDYAHYNLAGMAYRVGEKSELHCDSCNYAPGCFMECVLICEGKHQGGCVNCFLMNSIENCSLLGKYKYDSFSGKIQGLTCVQWINGDCRRRRINKEYANVNAKITKTTIIVGKGERITEMRRTEHTNKAIGITTIIVALKTKFAVRPDTKETKEYTTITRVTTQNEDREYDIHRSKRQKNSDDFGPNHGRRTSYWREAR